MKFIKRVVLRTVCFPQDLIGLIALSVVCLVGGFRLFCIHGVFSVELDVRTWLGRKYAGWGGTTFSPHCVMFGNGQVRDDVIKHELVHCEQYEAAAVASAALAAGVWLVTGHALYAASQCVLAPWVIMGAAYATAWLRNEESVYRGAHIEEAAYGANKHDH